ncbi:glutamate--putrescine ligase [Plasticicumulans lactativorans]|uniref:Glutamate--putrescine ligase n=1 Tax=Plasticicumulans lactativorans TaxID=1133106 RepID=A0A4R2L5F4_9GAMM|nr:glutamine synthetase family protein [Plasticicumulans lactativorans]TCO81930.1 glutamate--putrescine ligase [Plasticicumulans lactativorans]
MSVAPSPSVLSAEAAAFLAAHPDTETFELLIPDTNGVIRGKWVPRSAVQRAFEGGIRLPSSVFAIDIWGNDVHDSGLVYETGDRDALCIPVPGTLKPVPWLHRPTAQALMAMYEPDGQPFFGDPSNVLEAIMARFEALGLTPVVATELEFYLLDRDTAGDGTPQPPVSPLGGGRSWSSQVYGIEELHAFEDFFDGITRGCKEQELPIDTFVAEQAPSQFEVNLKHVADASLAADHAVLLKRVIKGVAQAHGMSATFMAKPFGQYSGNGMHVHMSLIDRDGRNVFDDGTPNGSALLRHAVAGLKATMADTMALYAPNTNSYRRFAPGTHAPTTATWGYDNRSTALRIPSGERQAMRFEHRVAGADANPHLVLAGILAGAHYGIVNRLDPGEPVRGSAYERGDASTLPNSLDWALEEFERSAFVQDYLGEPYVRLYAACRRQELAAFGKQVTPLEYDSYLRTV